MLDELDKELERRGHKFCRYADDCNIYVRSMKAGDRVMKSVSQFLGNRLRLKVNEAKSAVAHVCQRKFLGYSFKPDTQLKVAPQSLEKFKKKIRELTKRNKGRNLESIIIKLNQYLNGWINYFRLSTNKCVFENLDSWIRRRLRCYRIKQRKRGWSIVKYLMELGLSKQHALQLGMSSKGLWRKSRNPIINMAMPISWFESLGLVSLESKFTRFNNLTKTAVCDNARTVV